MPHLLSSARRHRAGPAICAAVLAAAAAACSGPAAPPPATAAVVTQLSGAGSTFDAPFFTSAFTAYQQAHPSVGVSYAAVGSGGGITQFTAGKVNFGATDVPASAADLATARGGDTVQIPVDLGAVAIAYNVLTRTNSPLKLSGPVLAKIFLGQITKWDDPAITALNPGADLPDVVINVIHRADSSGTTYIFSNYLSDVSPAWAASPGTGRSLHWPVGYGANGNAGVAAPIQHTPYSIGYAERSYTTSANLGFAAIRNQSGDYVTPTSAAIAADAAARTVITASDFSIVNQPGASAYPICGYSWVLVSARQPSTAAGRALIDLLNWLTHAGQPYAAALGYVPLPSAVQSYASSALGRVTGPDGQPLAD